MTGAPAGRPPSVLVVGDVMVDILVQPEGPLATGADRRATIRAVPGGSGANAAVWLAAHGMRTRFAGRVGRGDHASQTALFAEAGVDAILAADDTLPTGCAVALISPGGERSFLTDRGANERLSAVDLPESLLDEVDMLHVSAYSLFAPGPRAAALALIQAAKRRRILTGVDMASDSLLAEAGPDYVLAWTRGMGICFANEPEATVLTGSTELDRQFRSLLDCYDTVVIKRGAEGAAAATAACAERWSVPASPCPVVDSTGAGDAFLGGFLNVYLRGGNIESSLRGGVESGSRAVGCLGGRPRRANIPLDLLVETRKGHGMS